MLLFILGHEDQHTYERHTMERILNGDIVTDSESDNPELYLRERMQNLLNEVQWLNGLQRENFSNRAIQDK